MVTMWERIDQLGVRNLSIVGVSKHAGKTTTLNRLIEDAAMVKRRLAIASIGIDGERHDHLMGTPKPEIWVPEHTFFATAISMMEAASAPVSWKVPTGIESPFGEVWVGQTTGEGTIGLAGVRQLAHLEILQGIFQTFAVEHILWDGALSRMIAVNPRVSDGVVLATGAVLGTLAKVTQHTQHALRRLNVEALPKHLFEQLLMRNAGVLVAEILLDFGNQDLRDAEVLSIEYVHEAGAFTEDVRTLATWTDQQRLFLYAGAVTDRVLQSFQNRKHPVFVVAMTPSHLFVTEDAWRSFARAGHQLLVRKSVPLIGVTVNPTSPRNVTLDPQVLKQSIQSLTNAPVWDVME
ncbi:hypothetical protein [Sulfoacidibacillus ferrooxidans]|uniref:Uncharacterized protein n=1 Tax=Sulfoacidibacillus ferrooxidans TaxID=2005001 RepID=A0A9X1VAU1_9BACL|nr:hypothetical protein [Sulfoacidibacillus ferrooxidans]MCI0183328.1 hypothetical protein [Sulfoacidibacillus ferrooxidans]